jgi:hypothetical protein
MSLSVGIDAKTLGGFKPIGGFETFICRGCGYTEWYADNAAAIEPDEKLGIRLLDTEPKAGLR